MTQRHSRRHHIRELWEEMRFPLTDSFYAGKPAWVCAGQPRIVTRKVSGRSGWSCRELRGGLAEPKQ